MSTRARIGIQQGKRIIASYQHWDGYTGGLGYNLIENWEDPAKVTRGIMLGDSFHARVFIAGVDTNQLPQFKLYQYNSIKKY